VWTANHFRTIDFCLLEQCVVAGWLTVLTQ
jgi:hypothetical protein